MTQRTESKFFDRVDMDNWAFEHSLPTTVSEMQPRKLYVVQDIPQSPDVFAYLIVRASARI